VQPERLTQWRDDGSNFRRRGELICTDSRLSKKISPAHLIARLRTAQRILTLEHSLRAVLEEEARQATTDTLTGATNRRYFTRNRVTLARKRAVSAGS
jgi:PleD family two-component response regulator